MNKIFKAACVQNCASADVDANVNDSDELVRQAAAEGALFISTPEFFSCFDVGADGMQVGEVEENAHPVLAHFRNLASELGVVLNLGSLAIQTDKQKNNRSFVINESGEVIARYNKIHMFDVDLANGESYRESDTFACGGEAVIADASMAKIGLSVCYDLRFAYLYRALAQAGAQVLTVPAAFMKTTGEAHWHTLIRTRAIETGSYVVAPCQWGQHGKAKTYGHSLIVAPWGEVLADGGEERGIVVADIDLEQVTKARRAIPALKHDRDFEVQHVPQRLSAVG